MERKMIGRVTASHYYQLIRRSELEISREMRLDDNVNDLANPTPSTSTFPQNNNFPELPSPEQSQSLSSSYLDASEIGYLSESETDGASNSDSISDSISDSSSDDDTENQNNKIMKEKLACFVKHFSLSRAATSEMLKINREHGHPELPITREALLGTPMKKIQVRECAPGSYYHYGLKNALLKCNYPFLISCERVEIDINIDGVAMSKSSKSSTWPILGKFVNELNASPFVIGMYAGYGHPQNIDDFLEDLIPELDDVQRNGIRVTPQKILKPFCVRAFICDSPARAFVTGTFQYNGIFGCNKCHQECVLIDSRRYFTDLIGPLRTDTTFRNREHIEHHQPQFHQSLSLIESINIGMVSQFVIDPMHAIDLGVMRKMLIFIFFGNKVIAEEDDKKKLDYLIISMKKFIPYEFQRKTRSAIDELKRWKAVELRMFLLYIGIVVLKDCVPSEVYFHFLLFSTAIRLISDPGTYQTNADLAQTLLQRFVSDFPKIYGQKLMTFNVHALLHIVDCVRQFGPLYNFSAYPFENFQREVKKYTKLPNKILQQVFKRLEETDGINQRNAEIVLGFVGQTRPIDCDRFPGCNTSYKGFKYNSFLLKNNNSDNCCRLNSDELIEVQRFTEHEGESLVVAKKFTNPRSVFESPVDSESTLGIVLVGQPSDELFVYKVADVNYKLVRLPYKSEFILIPFLHSSQ